MKKKTLLIILLVVVVLIIALIVGKKSGLFGKTGNFKQVETTIVEKMNITETVSATGKIQPEVEVKLSSEVSGEIIELPIAEGQEVKKGDLLVKINPDLYQSSLQRSEASYQNIKANLSQTEASLKQAINAINQSVDSKVAKGLIDTKIVAQKDFYGFTNQKISYCN